MGFVRLTRGAFAVVFAAALGCPATDGGLKPAGRGAGGGGAGGHGGTVGAAAGGHGGGAAGATGGATTGSGGRAATGGSGSGGAVTGSGGTGTGASGGMASGGAPGGMGGSPVGGAGGPSGAPGGGGANGPGGAPGNTDGGVRDGAVGAGGGTAGSCPGLFCEDFEKGQLDPAIWTVAANGGQPAAAVQRAIVAHGNYAAQFHALPNVESYSFIIAKNGPAGLRGHHFGRAYFYVTPKPPAAHTEYLYAGTSGFPKPKYLEVAGINNTWQLTYVNLQVAPTGEKYASGGSTPLMRWICLEWEFNDTPDQITVFVDGRQDFAFPSINYNGATSGLVGGFTDFGFGFYAWHPATYAFDIYYDDIVLDTKRVGCLP